METIPWDVVLIVLGGAFLVLWHRARRRRASTHPFATLWPLLAAIVIAAIVFAMALDRM